MAIIYVHRPLLSITTEGARALVSTLPLVQAYSTRHFGKKASTYLMERSEVENLINVEWLSFGSPNLLHIFELVGKSADSKLVFEKPSNCV
jgi:hypothetical protein